MRTGTVKPAPVPLFHHLGTEPGFAQSKADD